MSSAQYMGYGVDPALKPLNASVATGGDSLDTSRKMSAQRHPSAQNPNQHLSRLQQMRKKSDIYGSKIEENKQYSRSEVDEEGLQLSDGTTRRESI